MRPIVDLLGHASCFVSAAKIADHNIDPTRTELVERRGAIFRSLEGTEPDGVTDAVMARFGDALKGASLVRNPAAVHRKTAFVWNEACRLPGFPGRPVTLPSYRPIPKRAAVPEALLRTHWLGSRIGCSSLSMAGQSPPRPSPCSSRPRSASASVCA